jgi:hypothetical protein
MQEQFFSVTHATPVNVIPMPADFRLPTLEALEASCPTVSHRLRHYLHRSGEQPVAAQPERVCTIWWRSSISSPKIDMIMGYVLAARITLSTASTCALAPGTHLHPHQGHGRPRPAQIVRLKIFLRGRGLRRLLLRRGCAADAGSTAPT